MTESVISVANVSKTYSSGPVSVQALKAVSLEIQKGDLLAVTGKSGAGKSTLLNVIGGIERPDNGMVKVRGVSLYDMSEQKMSRFKAHEIGFVFQAFNLVQEMSVLDNIRLPHYILRRPVDRQFEQELVARLGLGHRLGFFPDQLSGGEQQRVAIIRALLLKPSVILADEPTGNLDSETTGQFLSLLKEANQELGQTIILVTHDEQAARIGTRHVVVMDGRIEEARAACGG